jgi:hypothetical protein
MEGLPSLRAADNAVRLDSFDIAAYAALAAQTHYLSASHSGWRWCVGSSNVFRRSIVERFLPRLTDEPVSGGTDAYFTPILHAATGTNLIDRPLNAYSIHDANFYSRLEGLVGIWTSDAMAQSLTDKAAELRFIDLIDNPDRVLATIPAARYWQFLDTLASDPGLFSRGDVKAALARQYERLAALAGEQALLSALLQRMRPRDCLDIVLAARNGVKALSSVRRLVLLELRRSFAKSA